MEISASQGALGQDTWAIAARRPRSLWSDARQRLLRNKAALAGMLYIAFLVVIAVAAPFIAPHRPLDIYPANSYRQAAWLHPKNRPHVSGNWSFPLGTDSIGRDVFSRLIYGTRTSLIVGFIPMALTLFIGVLVGLIAGFEGGLIDTVLMRFGEFVYSFPSILFFIISMTALKDTPVGRFLNGFLILFAALSLVGWVDVARLVRGQVLSLREKEFVEAARALGVRRHAILLKHVLPNCLGSIIVSGAFLVPGAIMVEAGLSYLGIGLRPATDPSAIFPVSWGNMILEGKAAINAQEWLMLAPGVAIVMITLAFTFIGDGLRDALDPRESS
ncbi:MAG: ABC transporter permease [Herpetosiphonaceae bacterium]|nr:ABC transporter permease [Herpetosiphonaceae bacterium]